MSLIIEIAASPALSTSYEHGIELAAALSDAGADVTVFLSGEASLAAMALSRDGTQSIFIKKLRQLELLKIRCVSYEGLKLGPVLAFVDLLDADKLKELICNSSKNVVF